MLTLRTATFLERDSCETCEIFENTLFYWKSPVAASDSFRFPALKVVAQTVFLEKKGALRNFAKFTEKHLCQGLYFNKVPGQVCNFIEIENLAQVFFCEFCEISKNTFSYRLPPVAAFAACNFIKKEIPAKMSFYEFRKIFENIFWQSTSGWLVYKFICEFWEVFQNISFIQHLWETAYLMYKLQYFNQQIQWRTISEVLLRHCIQEQKK